MISRSLRKRRVRNKRQFRKIFDEGIFVRGTILNLWVYTGLEANPKTQGPLLGLIVPRKTDPRATRRNLWKRRIREAFFRNESKLKSSGAYLIQSKTCKDVPTFKEIEQEFCRLLSKVGRSKK